MFLLFCSLQSYGLDYYWVGGTGNWSDITHWATTSGGSAQHIVVPLAGDNVIFDANSFTGPDQTVTINSATVICRNMTWTGVTNSPTLIGTPDKILQIFGSLTLDPNMNFAFEGTIVFNGTEKNIPIDLAGHDVLNSVNFQSPTGGWILNSALTVLKTINIDGGDLNMNGQPLNVFNLFIRPAQASIVDFSNSQIIIGYEPTGTGPPNADANLKINSDVLDLITTNSRIEMPAQKAEMQIKGSREIFFNEVSVTNPLSQFILNDPAFVPTPISVHFNTLSMLGNGRIYGDNFLTEIDLTAGKTYVFGINYTQTIGQLNASGLCNAPIRISSNVNGNTANFLFSTDQSIVFVNIKGINATGGGRYDVISGNDEGNNNGWTFDGSGEFDLYWVGGSGNWDDPFHWSTTSGGVGGMCIPSALSNVHFDINSFSAAGQVVTVNIDDPECHTMDWTGSTGIPRFQSNSNSILHIHGSLIFIPETEILFLGKFSFESQNQGNTITTASHEFLNEVIFNGDNGEWMFLDEFRVNNAINHKAGEINSNDQYMLSTGFSSVSAQDRMMILGASIWDITSPAAISWLQSGSTFSLDAGTSTINASANSIFFINANTDLQFHHIHFMGASGTLNSTASNIYIEEFRGVANIKFEGKLDAGTLRLYPGKQYGFGHNTGESFNFNTIIANGQCDGYITIASLLGGVTTQFNSPNAQNVENVVIQDIHFSGGQTYLADNSVDRGNTDGWMINGNASRTLYWVGDSGNWEEPVHWSLMSGGPGGECIPTANDDVIFDQNSFSMVGQSVTTANNTIGNCRAMTWINTQPNSKLEMSQIDAFGSIILDPAMNYLLQKLILLGSSNNSVTTNGVEVIEMDVMGTGSWVVTDNVTFDNISVFHGSFSSQGYDLTGKKFKGLNDAIINIENSTLILSGSSGAGSGTFHIDNEMVNISAQGSNIFLTNNTTASVLGKGAHELDFVHFVEPSAQGIVKSTRIGSDIGPAQPFMRFRTVIFAGDGEMIGNNHMDSLLFSPGKHYVLESQSIQRIEDYWRVRGFQCLQLNLHSSVPNMQGIVEKSTGTVDGDYIIMRDITARGGAAFFAGRYSNDLGGNSGWTFMERPDFSVSGILGDDFYLCIGDEIILNGDSRISDDATLSWNGSITSNTYLVNTPGTITLQAIFGDGCELSDSIKVMPGPVIDLNLGPDILTCDKTPITLTAVVSNSDPIFTWSDGSLDPSLMVDSSGIYYVDVEVTGCSQRDSIFVDFNSAIPVDILQDTIVCEGNTYTASLNDSLGVISWITSTVGNTESFSAPGTYWAEINKLGCVTRDSFNLDVRILNIPLGSDSTVCINESISLDAAISDPLATYLWSDGTTSSNFMVSSEGVYKVSVTSGGCTSIDSISINVDEIPNLNLSPSYQICTSDSILFDLSTFGLDFVWNSMENTPRKVINQSGVYTLIASRGNCSEDFSFTVDVLDAPIVNLGNDTLVCDDTPINLMGGNLPGQSYAWSDGSTLNTLQVDQSGSYFVEVIENGCSGFDTINVTLGGVPELGINDLIVICEGESIQLDVSEVGGVVTWSTGTLEPTEIFTNAGSYFVEISASGCNIRDSFDILVNPLPVINLGGDTSVCRGESLVLDASGASETTFTWTTGQTSPTINSTINVDQVIGVTATLNGCMRIDSIAVQAVQPPTFNLGNEIEICEGDQVELAVDQDLPVTWSDGSNGSSLVVDQAGKYWATGGVGSCTYTDSVDIIFSQAGQINLGRDTVICASNPLKLNAMIPNGSYNWSDGSIGGTLLVYNSGVYAVEVFDGFCSSTDTIEVFVEDCISLNMYIPNAFSPNDDGLNDEFKVFVEPDVQIQSYELTVFDRWGNLHFKSDDVSVGWDGTAPKTSAYLTSDVYVYLVKLSYIKNSNQFSIKRSGDIFLSR